MASIFFSDLLLQHIYPTANAGYLNANNPTCMFNASVPPTTGPSFNYNPWPFRHNKLVMNVYSGEVPTSVPTSVPQTNLLMSGMSQSTAWIPEANNNFFAMRLCPWANPVAAQASGIATWFLMYDSSNCSIPQSFTPPPAPFVSDSNTIGLWHLDNSWADSTANAYTLVAASINTGGVAFDSTNFKFGTHSGKVTGGGFMYNNTFRAIGTNDFTIEGWFYPTAGSGTLIDLHSTDIASDGVRVSIDAQGFLGFYTGTNTTPRFSTQLQMPFNQWSHVCVSRVAGGFYRVYLNGIPDQNNYTPYSAVSLSSVKLTIGMSAQGTLVNNFSGNIDEIRISSIPRYTAQYTTTDLISAPAIIGTVGVVGSSADLELLSTNVIAGNAYTSKGVRLQFPTMVTY